jgi:hypothetical protein
MIVVLTDEGRQPKRRALHPPSTHEGDATGPETIAADRSEPPCRLAPAGVSEPLSCRTCRPNLSKLFSDRKGRGLSPGDRTPFL